MIDGVDQPATDHAPNRDGPELTAWDPWSPQRVYDILQAATAPWCVAGGWAIDLWLDRRTRPHGDIEIAAPRESLMDLRRCLEPRFRLFAVANGATSAIRMGARFPVTKHQCWVSDPAAGTWRLDVMLEPGDRRTWVYRRDRRIRESREKMIGRRGEIPFLNPEGVLLYKAKACRDKDEADFAACLPHLSPDARTWLATSLSRAHPGHHWLEVLR